MNGFQVARRDIAAHAYQGEIFHLCKNNTFCVLLQHKYHSENDHTTDMTPTTNILRFKSILEYIILCVIGIFILSAPYYWHFSSYLIGGIGGLALIYGICFGSFSAFKNAPWRRYARCFMPMICLYLLALIGTLYTDCPKPGRILENDLSFIVFPAIFLLLGPGFFTLKRLKILSIVFYASCLLIIAIFLTYMFLALSNPHLKAVYDEQGWMALLDMYSRYPSAYIPKSGLRFWVHHTFQSWYMLTAMSIIVYTLVIYPQWYKQWYKKLFNIAMLFAFIFLGIFLDMSKMGCLMFAFWCAIAVAFLLYKHLSVWSALGIVVLLVGLVSVFLLYSPSKRQVLETTYKAVVVNIFDKKSASEIREGSVKPRIVMWRKSVEAIKEKPLFGWGTGTERCLLVETGYDHPHNQWLLDGIRFGLIGILALAWLFVTGFRQAYKSRNGLLTIFMLLTFCFTLTDRNLDTKLGIIFFGLMYGLFVAFSFIGQGDTGHTEAKRTDTPKPLVSDK
ncbi:MAG: O-antigen ligase family protein [Bacteroidales bacterium]|nr:O-antigen ligase family protein [Bacteroidales bacterium]